MNQSGILAAQRAADHADRVSPGEFWSKLAWVRLLEYVMFIRTTRGTGEKSFTTEQFRAWADFHELPAPPDPRAFGNITRKAQKRGVIRKSKLRGKACDRAHGRDVTLWEVL